MSTYPPYYAYPSAPPVLRVVPNPPRLQWGFVLLLSIITLGFFGQIWLVVQSVWVRKVFGKSKALPWAIVYVSVLPVFFLCAVLLGVYGGAAKQNVAPVLALLTTFVRIALFVLWICTTFLLRGELEAEPLHIPLGGGMTFFFGPVYFQYHLFEYEVTDEVHAFRGPLRTELPVQPAPPPA